jgi:hypothetical protein
MEQFLAIRAFMCSPFVLMTLAKENAAVSACLETAPPVAPSYPSTEARAARLKKFQREQLIVDYLNRGVSVAEIAARVGLSEKRMRAVVREILARRMPHPPEEFVAIQVSRLNEALLIAFSAMSPTNLKAVDQVVKIVRELDRYHGFVAAQRCLPEPSRTEAPVEAAMAFGAALVCRPEFALQDFEMVGFTPEDPLAPLQRGEGWGDLLPAGGEKGRLAASAGDNRPGIPPQGLENIESAPGNGWPAEAPPAPDDSTPMIRTPTGWRRQNIRILLNGVAAC